MTNTKHRIVGASLAALLMVCAACGTSGPSRPKATGKNPAAAPGGGLQLSKVDSPVKIVMAGSTGIVRTAEDRAIRGPFTQQTGHTFQLDGPAELAKIKAMVASGRTIWDTSPGGSALAVANCGTLFEELDRSLYDPAYLSRLPKGVVSPCAIPSYRFASIFTYSTKAFGDNPPTSIKDFFDTNRFPGKRVVKDEANNGLYEAALVSSGVAPKDVYPIDVARAHKEMDKIKGDLLLEPTVSAVEQALASGEAVMAIAPSGVTVTSAKLGAPLAPVWDFSTYAVGGYSVVKNAPHEQQAQQVVAFAATKQAQLDYAVIDGVSPADPAIKNETIPYSPIQRKFDAFAPGRGTTLLRDIAWYRDNFGALSISWTKWKVG